MLSLVLAEPNIIHLAYREGGNGLTLHVLSRVGAVGRWYGADDHFSAAPPRTLFHLPGLLASPASPCLSRALLKSRFFSLCVQHREQQSREGGGKPCLGLVNPAWFYSPAYPPASEEQGWGLTGELRACCLPRSPLSSLLARDAHTHLLQASFGLPPLPPGAGAVPVPSGLEPSAALPSAPAAPPRAEPFSRRS